MRDVVAVAHWRAEHARARKTGVAFDVERAMAALEKSPVAWGAPEHMREKTVYVAWKSRKGRCRPKHHLTRSSFPTLLHWMPLKKKEKKGACAKKAQKK